MRFPALGAVHVFASSSDWFIGLSIAVVNGQSYVFGFSTPILKVLYVIQLHVITKIFLEYLFEIFPVIILNIAVRGVFYLKVVKPKQSKPSDQS